MTAPLRIPILIFPQKRIFTWNSGPVSSLNVLFREIPLANAFQVKDFEIFQNASKKVFICSLGFRYSALTSPRQCHRGVLGTACSSRLKQIIYFLDECSYLSSICFDAPVPSAWRLPIYPRVLLLVTLRYMFLIFSDPAKTRLALGV